MKLKKYDIVMVNLNPKKGHAQAGKRPAVIIQSNLFNPYASTVMIVPLTTQEKKIFPSEFLIQPSQVNGLSSPSRFLGSQIMTIDKVYIGKHLGTLEDLYFPHVNEALNISLDWENNYI